MPAAKYSDEFKEQVVREVVEKERTISSVASSYDLVPQTVGNWVARYKKAHATDQDRKKASESAEIAKLRAENRELRQENEFLKKAAAFFAKERPCPSATRSSTAKKATIPSPQCADGPGYQNQVTTPGATDPSHRRPSGGRSWP